ncbi:hypothetical protein [Jeongeupia chitinilytica]|uniref:Transporter n=1 Tax=Jeongeupia chitinilytica TaxID=1041641 RepID=A0ABQ3H253_9NEIS|nr:hypothetical protein [Jeongeupia chitinilytica]GHD66493.1 hypothetical protein GCM10007350_28790 [Jeongeupia chitinilytica]
MRHRLKPIALAGLTVGLSLAGTGYAAEATEAATPDATAAVSEAAPAVEAAPSVADAPPAAPVVDAVPVVDTQPPPAQVAESAVPQQVQAETAAEPPPAGDPMPAAEPATTAAIAPEPAPVTEPVPPVQTAAEAPAVAATDTPAEAPPPAPQAAAAAEPPVTKPSQQPTMTLQEAAEILAPGVLTPKGTFVLDPSIQYSYTNGSRVALVGYTVIPAVTVGLIDIRQENRSSWTAALTGRYGLTNRAEIEVRVPYVYSSDESLDRPFLSGSIDPEVFNTKGNGISDVELAMRYQLNQPPAGSPYYVAALRAKSDTGKGTFDVPYDIKTGLPTELPTGSGFWGLQGTLSAIVPSDPAVFFGSFSYMWNIKSNVNKIIAYRVPETDGTGAILPNQFTIKEEHIGEVDPGDVYELAFGMGFGINERASFSLAYDHSFITKTKINGEIPTGSTNVQVGILQLGWSYRINASTTANLTLGVGTTDYSPDVQLSFRLPITF